MFEKSKQDDDEGVVCALYSLSVDGLGVALVGKNNACARHNSNEILSHSHARNEGLKVMNVEIFKYTALVFSSPQDKRVNMGVSYSNKQQTNVSSSNKLEL